MAIVLGSAGFMWQAKGHLFLVPLGIVSGYLVINGWRVLARNRRRVPSRIANAIDVALSFVVMAAGVCAAYLGIEATTPLMLSIRAGADRHRHDRDRVRIERHPRIFSSLVRVSDGCSRISPR